MDLRRSLRLIPNALTAARIGVALAFPLVPGGAQLALLAVAMATEALDGALARRFGWQTDLGRMLDPVADKLLLVSVAGTFLYEGRLAWWELLAVGVRDLAVVLGAALAALRGQAARLARMQPGFYGKLTTGLQYLVLLAVLLGQAPGLLVALPFAAGVAATVQYGRAWFSAAD